MAKRITSNEANPEGYSGFTKVVFKGEVYDLLQIDFEEDLVAIDICGDIDNPSWKRIESCDKIYNQK